MKISEAYIELFPQLNTAFATQVRTDTTRIGETAGQVLSAAIASGLARNERSITQAAERTGTSAGQALVNRMTQALQSDSTIQRQAQQRGEAAGTALAEGAASGLNAGSASVSRAAGEVGEEAGHELAQRSADEAQAEWLRGLSGAAREAGERAGRELSESAGDAMRQSNALEEAAEDAANEAADAAGTEMEQQLKSNLADAGMVAGAAMGAALIAATVGAMDAQSVTNKLAAQLGAGPEMSKEFGALAGRVYAANYGESLDEVADAVKNVWQKGLVDEDAATADIEAVTKNAINLASVMEEEVGSVTTAISQMLKTGMADSAEEAFDILTRATQQGLNANEDLLDTFNEYGTQFRKLGLDGTDALGLISQGLRGGARDADIVADAFKEFSIRAMEGGKDASAALGELGLNASDMVAIFNKGGPEAKAALAEVVTQLNDMEDSAERNAIGVALFGTQWEDLGDAFRSFDVGGASKELGDVTGAAAKMDATLGQGAAATIESFKRQITQTFVEVLGNRVLPIIMNTVTWLKEHESTAKALGIAVVSVAAGLATYAAVSKTIAAVTTAAAVAQGLWAGATGVSTAATATNTVALAANKVGLVAYTVVTKAVAAATKAWTAIQWLLNAAFVGSPIGAIILVIVALVAAIVIAYKNSETFRKIVDAVWKAIKKAIEAVVDWFVKNAMPLIKKYLELAGAWFEFLWKVVQKVWDGIKVAFNVWWSFAQPWFKAVGKAIQVLGEVFEWLYNNVVKPVWAAIQKVIEVWWTVVSAIWKAIISFLQTTFKAAWDTYGKLIETVWNAMKAVIETWWNVVKAVWTAIITFLATTFKAAWDTYKKLFETVWNAMEIIMKAWWTVVSGIWNVIITFLQVTFKAAWDAYKAVFEVVWAAMELIIRTWWTIVSGIWNIIIAFLQTTFTVAWQAFQAMVTAVWNAIQLIITTVWNFIRDVIFTPIITFLQTVFTVAWQTFQAMITAVWNAIQLVITTVWTFIRDMIFTPIMNFLSGVFVPAWNTFKDLVSQAWTNLQNNISNTWNWIRDNIFAPIQTMLTQTLPNAFSSGVDAIARAWDRIKEAAKLPVKFVVDTIINGGIIKALNWIGGKVGAANIPPVEVGFKTGGIYEQSAANGAVLPGWSPGRDIHEFVSRTGGRLRLSGGEAIMRPEFTKGVGKGFINFFNRLARTGGVGAIRKYFGHGHGHNRKHGPPDHGGWADGGVIEWMKKLFPAEGNQKPWTKPYFKKGTGDGDGWVSNAWSALTDPSDAFKKGVESLFSGIPGGAWMKDLGKKSITHEVLPKAIEWIKDKIKGVFSLGGTTSSITPIGGSGGAISSYTGLMAALHAVFPGLTMISGYRPGSHTLSGALSYHARGRAVDVPARRDVAEWIVKNYGATSKEIITPWRELNWWNGHPHKYNTAVEAQHGVFGNNAHVHWAMKQGGILGNMPTRLFDTGGILNHKEIGLNMSGRPERVLSPQATEDYDRLNMQDVINELKELRKSIENVGKDVGGEIKSSSRAAVVRGRTA